MSIFHKYGRRIRHVVLCLQKPREAQPMSGKNYGLTSSELQGSFPKG